MEKRFLRDDDVRSCLAAWLTKSHLDDSARVLHELKVPRPSARIDVALVNGELASYEIKSDVDSLDRLRNQIPACNRVFDRAYIVTTSRHIRGCLHKIPSWWGIVIACQDRAGVFVSQVRPSQLNIDWCIKSSLHVLTKTELRKIEKALCERLTPSNVRRETIVDSISENCDNQSIRASINEALKNRSN